MDLVHRGHLSVVIYSCLTAVVSGFHTEVAMSEIEEKKPRNVLRVPTDF